MTTVRVRFVDEASSILSRLDVEGPHGGDLFELLMQALFNLRIQVVSCEARLDAPRWTAALSLVEFDGAPIGPKRRAEVQATVFGLFDATLTARPLAARQPSALFASSG
jgi:hypothetical protein